MTISKQSINDLIGDVVLPFEKYILDDELIGQIDVVQKPMRGVLQNHPYISGTSLLGNGKPLFVIKPDVLFKI